MRNKHKQKKAFLRFFSEKRLLNLDYAPDGKYEMYSLSGVKVEGLSDREIEKNRERWQEVIQTLKDSAINNNNQRQLKLLENPEIVNMIVGMVYIGDDKTINWLPEAAKMLIEVSDETYTGEEEEMEKIRSRVGGKVSSWIASVKDHRDSLKDERVEFNANDSVLKADTSLEIDLSDAAHPSASPAKGNALDRIQAIVDGITLEEGDLRQRQKALVAMARMVIKRKSEDGLKPLDITDLISEGGFSDVVNNYLNTFVVNELGPLVTVYEKNPNPETFAALQNDILKKIEAAAELPLVMEENKEKDFKADLVSARAAVTARIASLNVAQRALLDAHPYVEKRDEYLEFIAGTDISALIAASIVRPEYTMDFASLSTKLLEIDKDADGVTKADLQKAAGLDDVGTFASHVNLANLRELVALLKTNTGTEHTEADVQQAAFKLLKNGLPAAKGIIATLDESYVPYLLAVWDQTVLRNHLNARSDEFRLNPTVTAVGQLLQRAFLDETEAKALRDVGLATMSVGTMVDIAMLPEMKNAAGEFKDVIDPALAGKLVRMMGEIKIQNAADPSKNVWKISREKFKEVMLFIWYKDSAVGAAQTDVTTLLASLDAEATTTNGDNIEISQFDLFEQMTGQAMGEKAKTLFGEIESSELRDMKWTESMRKVTLETMDTFTVGGSKWWEWLSNMPNFYLDETLNGDLLKIMDQRNALNEYVAVIDDVLRSPELYGKKEMASSITQMREIQKQQEKVLEATSLTATVWEHIKGAELLMGSVDYIERTLGDEWRQMPPLVRRMAFWLAMNKPDRDVEGNISLAVAENFIAGWYRTDRATLGAFLTEYTKTMPPEARRNFYLGGMRQQEAAVLGALPPEEFVANEAKFIDAFIIGLSLEDKQNMYINRYLEDNKGDTTEMKKYLAHVNGLQEVQGEHVLNMALNRHGVTVRPLALQAIMGLNRTRTEQNGQTIDVNIIIPSMLVGRWEIDRDRSPMEQAAVAEALNIALDGPSGAKMAIIDAFINRRKTSYKLSPTGDLIFVEPSEASQIVADVIRHLKNVATQREPFMQQLEKEDIHSNPIEAGLRSTVDAMRNMWAGDGVDKGILIAGVFVTAWMLKNIWKKGAQEGASGLMKMARWAMIGLPIMLIANKAYQSKTGKDKLGEWLRHVPKEERDDAFWQYFNDLSGNERYKGLNSNAGHEAIKAITGPKSNVSVEQLLDWRENVQASGDDGKLGYNDYMSGAPEGLNVSSVQYELGDNPSAQNEAYRLAFLAFEANCVWVAAQKGMDSSDPDVMAEMGADYIRTEYVDLRSWQDTPDVRQKLAGRHVNMAEVIMNEMYTPEKLTELQFDRTIVEWGGDVLGQTPEVVGNVVNQYVTKSKLHFKRVLELTPELAAEAWEKVSDSAEDIYDWMRVTGEKLYDDVGTNLSDSWRAFLNTAEAAGILISKGARGAVEVTADFAAGAADLSIDAAISLYRIARRHQGVGNLVNGVEHVLQEIFGANIADLIALRELVKTDDEQIDALSKEEKVAKGMADMLKAVVNLPGVPQGTVTLWLKNTTEELYGAGKFFKDLLPYERMMVAELMKRRAYSLVVAERIRALEALHAANRPNSKLIYPLPVRPTVWDWTKLSGVAGKTDKLAEEIEQSFGWNTLSLIGVEQNLAGYYQQWVSQLPPGKTRPPLEFLHWVASTVTLDNATKHMMGEMEVYKDQFRDYADEAFAVMSDADKEKNMERLESYLETIITNVALEASLGAKHADMLRASSATAPTGGLVFTEQMATDVIEYIKTLRGASADVRKLTRVMDKLDAFESHATGAEIKKVTVQDPALFALIQSTDPTVGAPPPAAAAAPAAAGPLPPLIPTEEARMRDIIAETAANINLAEMDELLKFLDRATPADRTLIHNTFDDIAKHYNLDTIQYTKLHADPDLLAKTLRMVQGVGDAALISTVRNKLSDHYKDYAGDMPALFAMESSASVERATPIRDALDQGIVKNLETLAPGIPAPAVLKTKTLTELENDYITPLVKLYKVATADKTQNQVADCIMLIIEHVLYRGEDNPKIEGGKKGFEKLSKYMETKWRITDMPTEESYYFEDRSGFNPYSWVGSAKVPRDGSKNRMAKSVKHTAGYLNIDLSPRITHIKERFK